MLFAKALFGLLFGFGLALAVQVGSHVTIDGQMLLLGIFTGVVASIPAALVLIWRAKR